MIRRQRRYGLGLAFGIKADLTYLIQNLGLLIGAGVDIISALESIEQGIKSVGARRVLTHMREDIARGESLASVFQKTGLFPRRISSLVSIGEESGQLATYFRMIATQEEKQHSLNDKIRSALLYPIFVLIITLVVGVGVAWFILPKLAHVFDTLHLKLPLITRVVLGFGSFLGQYGLIAVPLFVLVLGGVLYILFFFSKTRIIGEYLLFSVPAIRSLLQEVELTRLGFILGGLLKNGVPILEALESLAETTESVHYHRLYLYMEKRVEEGDSLAQTLLAYKGIDALIPAPIAQLIVTGSRSGTLADVLLRIGSLFEEKSDVSARNLSVLLEPVLLFIVWLAVVSVALGVILPIYNLIGGINHH